jgi:hypothetical protein
LPSEEVSVSSAAVVMDVTLTVYLIDLQRDAGLHNRFEALFLHSDAIFARIQQRQGEVAFIVRGGLTVDAGGRMGGGDVCARNDCARLIGDASSELRRLRQRADGERQQDSRK